MKMPRKVDPWVRRFEVCDPCLHSKGYTIYKITSTVFPRNCPEAATEVVVWKRFSEIKRLHKALRVYHSNLHLKGEFPSFPKEKLFGRFEPAVIEERRQSTLDMLEFVALNPPLFTSQIFVNFFETGKQSVVKNDEDKDDQTQVLQPASMSGQEDCEKHDRDMLREDSILSGVWQYRQTVDEISMDSNEESDDQDTIKEMPIGDDTLNSESLEIFDPYSPSHKNKVVTKEEVNDAWIISAFSTCSTLENNEQIPSGGLLFPQAFAEYENVDFSNVSNNDFSEVSDKNVEKNSPIADFSTVQETIVSKIDYNSVANQLLSSAKLYETDGDFNTAFDIYKRVIETLLNGLKEETDNLKIASYRRDIARHLSYAEKLYEKKLCGSSNTGDGNSVYYSQSNSVSNIYEVQLQRYKVLGVVYRVLLVLDTETNMTYVIKILSKSVRPNNASSQSNFPLQISHMVQLNRFHETEDSIFLVLQYATGGRLWNFVGSYLQSANVKLNEGLNDGSQECSSLANVYGGKKLTETSVFTNFSDQDEININSSGDYLTTSYQSSRTTKNVCVDEFQRVTYSKKENIVQGVGTQNNSKPISVHKKAAEGFLRNMDHVNTEDLVSNAQKLMKTVEETLRVSDEVTNNLDPVNNVHSKSVIEYDQKRPLSPTIAQELSRARLKNRKTSEGDPFATERSPSLLRESSGSVELQRNRIKHFSLVFQQMDDNNSQTNSLPEEYIRIWASEIISAVASLHKVGIICKDLKPENILLDDNGHIVLTYFGQSSSVDFIIDQYAKDSLYSAPEVCGIGTISSSCDWWSIGALLYELFTGKTLLSYHQSGFNSHTQLHIPTKISKEAESLLKGFLCYHHNERLGSGPMGLENIKAHPFFNDIVWN